MSKSRSKATAVLISAVLAAVATGVVIRFRSHQVAGVPPSYAPSDNDPRLSKEAAAAQPMIEAIARHRALHGEFPFEVSALDVSANEWVYAPQPGGYTLSKKLGWDPSLHYRFQQGSGRWVFDPGDGSPEREITL